MATRTYNSAGPLHIYMNIRIFTLRIYSQWLKLYYIIIVVYWCYLAAAAAADITWACLKIQFASWQLISHDVSQRLLDPPTARSTAPSSDTQPENEAYKHSD